MGEIPATLFACVRCVPVARGREWIRKPLMASRGERGANSAMEAIVHESGDFGRYDK